MRLLLDVKELGKPEKADMITFDGKFWKLESRESFLSPYVLRTNSLENNIKIIDEKVNNIITELKNDVFRQNQKIKVLEQEIRILKGEE